MKSRIIWTALALATVILGLLVLWSVPSFAADGAYIPVPVSAYNDAVDAPPSVGREFKRLALASFALTTGDVITTASLLRHRNEFHESWGPFALGEHPGVARLSLTLYGETLGLTMAGIWMTHHHHPRLGIALLRGRALAEAGAVANNSILLARRRNR